MILVFVSFMPFPTVNYVVQLCSKQPCPSTTTEQNVPAHLPPVGVLLVDYMEDVSLEKGQACLFTGDQVVCGWIIVEVWLQIDLKFRM